MYGRRKASPTPEDKGQTVDKDRPQDKDTVTGKTPEELALENEHLRTSLDEIASHAERLERANRALQAQHDERERTMRTIAVGMRREVRTGRLGRVRKADHFRHKKSSRDRTYYGPNSSLRLRTRRDRRGWVTPRQR
jgi:hypothetical protein